MAGVTADPLVPVRVASVGNRPRAKWAEGLRVHLPGSLLDRTGWRRAIRSNGDLEIPEDAASITGDDVVALRERCAFTERRPMSARLPVNYRLVPGWARAIAASAIGRWNRHRADRWAAFPGWPIDLSTDVLDDLRQAPMPAAPPLGRAPVVLTHDIDSPEGLQNLLARFLPLEEAVGARSTNYIVPCAWRLDDGLIAEMVARGHGVGVHGYDHSNTTAFATPAVRAERLDGTRRFAERYAAAGYRAPSLLRTRALLRDLGGRYGYDSSIPTAGGLFPIPNNGCATARPFLVEGIAELPVTMPRDGTLRFLGYSPDEIVRLWIDCADMVWRSRGVVVLLTHCERRFSGGPAMLGVYRRFLEHLRNQSDRFTFSNPRQVLENPLSLPERCESGERTRAAVP
jgi:peptidoglycan/xylan/chitin deacetylase (PgdA/CDA1 family)